MIRFNSDLLILTVLLLLTHDEEDGANQHPAREHMLCAVLLGWLAHGSQLVGEWVSPEVSQQQRAEEEGDGAVTGAPRHFHLCAADGLDVKLQDYDGEDDHGKRQDEGRPRFDFALGWRPGEKKSEELDTHHIVKSSHLIGGIETHHRYRMIKCQNMLIGDG